MSLRVLVCGGRDFLDARWLREYLDAFPITHLIHGGARGADACAASYADLRHIPQSVFNADWNAHGKAAGPMRNKKMLDEGKPDFVVAFPGGRGTADMVRRASDAGVTVRMPCNGFVPKR